MRSIFLFIAALFLGSFVVAAAPGVAGAGPQPALSAAHTAAGIVEAVDYTRRYGGATASSIIATRMT